MILIRGIDTTDDFAHNYDNDDDNEDEMDEKINKSYARDDLIKDFAFQCAFMGSDPYPFYKKVISYRAATDLFVMMILITLLFDIRRTN